MVYQTHQELFTGNTFSAHSLETPTANQIAIYAVKLKKDEDGRFVATVPQLPGVVTDGATEDEALDNVFDAIEAMLESKKLTKQFILTNIL